MNKNLKLNGLLIVMGVFAVSNLILVTRVEAAECKFDRDLDTTTVGEDVTCLQKYLNESGFVIATTGAGASGKETTEFKTLTKEAVIKWQKANDLSPASGVFGPKSRAKYQYLISGKVSTVTPVIKTLSDGSVDISPQALALRVAELKNQLSGSVTTPVKSTALATSTTSTIKNIKAVIKSLQDAEEEVSDNDDADDYEKALESLSDARKDFLLAVLSYLNSDTTKADSLLKKVERSVKDALDFVGSVSEDEKEADDLISEVDDNYSDAKDEISKANTDGKKVTKSNDLLKKAKTLLTQAKSDFENEDYKDAINSAEDADNLISDAVKAIGKNKQNADDYLDEVKDDLKSAKDDMNDAIDNGDDIGSAKSLLNSANSYLSDASDAIDDNDDDAAIKLIDKAVAKIKSAKNEF